MKKSLKLSKNKVIQKHSEFYYHSQATEIPFLPVLPCRTLSMYSDHRVMRHRIEVITQIDARARPPVTLCRPGDSYRLYRSFSLTSFRDLTSLSCFVIF